jgi:hypothetical protein
MSDENEQRLLEILFDPASDTRTPAMIRKQSICDAFQPLEKGRLRSQHDINVILHRVDCAIDRLKKRGLILVSEDTSEFITVQLTPDGYDAGRPRPTRVIRFANWIKAYGKSLVGAFSYLVTIAKLIRQGIS